MVEYIVHDINIFNDEKIKKNIGHNIAKYRNNVLKAKREGLMEALECSFCTIVNIETGKSYPSFHTIKNLTKLYNLPIYYFTMIGYEMNLDYSYRKLISGYTSAEQIEMLMHTHCEKYNMLSLYDKKRIEEMSSMEGHINYETIGYLIRFERIKRGMSLKEFADKINYTEKSLNNIETGNGKVSFKMLLCICNILHIPMDYFLVGCLENKENAINYMLMDLFADTGTSEREFLIRFVKLLEYRLDKRKENETSL